MKHRNTNQFSAGALALMLVVACGHNQSLSFSNAGAVPKTVVPATSVDANATKGTPAGISGESIARVGATALPTPSSDSVAAPLPSPADSPTPVFVPTVLPTPLITPVATDTPVVIATATAAPVLPVVIPTACDDSQAVTQASLISTSVKNNSPDAVFQYIVFLTNCSGQPLPLTADKIWFDINATISVQSAISYSMTPGTKPPASLDSNSLTGTLNLISGSDLFGVTAANYAHWETSQPVSITSASNSVVLQIFLPNVAMTPVGPDPKSLTTYLKYGNAAAVSTTVQLIGN